MPAQHVRAYRPLLALGFLFALCMTSACAREDAAEPATRSRTIATAAQRSWDAGDYVLVERFEVPELEDDWQAKATKKEIVQAPGDAPGTRALLLAAQERKYVDIPLPPDLAEFNRVTLKLVMRANSSAWATLLLDGKSVCRTPYATVIGHGYPQELSLDLPGARVLRRRPDTLRLSFAGGAKRVLCWDVALWHRPWESWAAELSAPESHPVLDHVSRPAGVIASDNGRGARVDVPPEEGVVLSFHYGNAPRLSHPHRGARVSVTLSSPASTETREYDLPRGEDATDAWSQARVDLTSFAGETVDVQFTLRSESGRTDFALVTPLTLHAPRPKPRTVLFVTSDTHRADHVAAIAGSVDVRTPTLDSLGERGVIFDDCYSTTNITIPSHVALLTATSPRDTLVLDNMSGLAESARTLAESFHENGFATIAAVSGPQLQHAWSGLGQGFDAMAAPDRMVWDGRETTAELEELIDEYSGRDLFVWLHLFDAHRPYDKRNRYLSEYWPEDRDPFDPTLPEPEFPVETLHASLSELRDPAYMDASYRSEVTYVDQVLADLFEGRRFDDAVIAVTADHGECLGEYDVWWNHAGLYPENLRVPLLLAGPGVPAGRRVTGPVQHLGIGRTLLDLAGLEDVAFPGRSLLSHVELEPDPDTPRFALCARATAASVELGDWFCVLNLSDWFIEGQPGRKEPHSVELYHLGPDGDPLRDVSGDEVERASRMRGLILDWLRDQQRTGWVESDHANNAARIQQVEALGYTAQAADGSSIWIEADCDCEPCAHFGRN